MIKLNLGIAKHKRRSEKLEDFIKRVGPRLVRGIDKVTLLAEREIKQELSKGGGFRIARSQGRAKWVRNPGKHLRVGDGTLRASWRSRKARQTSRNVVGTVGTNVGYAAIHEYGGRAGRNHATRIPKRPYVGPVVKREGKKFRDIISREITKPLQGRG